MTIVEFFDNTSIENIVSALLCNPDNVILIGDNHKRLKKHIELYDEIAKQRGLAINFGYRTANRNNLIKIVEVLSELVEENEICIFDLDGGEDLYLVAMGIVSERYKDKIFFHRFNVRNNTLMDCDADGTVLNTSPIEISVEENIRIYAGKVINNVENSVEWNFNNDFIDDIKVMWEICKQNARKWNSLCGSLARLNSHIDENNDVVSGYFSELNIDFYGIGLLKRLSSIGVIKNYKVSGESFSLQYKDKQIMYCLTKAGQLLELYITLMLRAVKNGEGTSIYNDVQTGIIMDWDGFDNDNEASEQTTINEIDVFAMKGLIPVFISCKNGSVDVDELYKLSTVADRFGGKYAKKILLVADWDCPPNHIDNITARAEDMRIKLIDNVADMTEKELCKTLSTLWC